MYEIQIFIFNQDLPNSIRINSEYLNGEWISIKPSGSNTKPYQYKTTEEAWNMLNMCYPDLIPERKKILYKVENEKSNSNS